MLETVLTVDCPHNHTSPQHQNTLPTDSYTSNQASAHSAFGAECFSMKDLSQGLTDMRREKYLHFYFLLYCY